MAQDQESGKGDPTAAPAFRKLVRHFLETPPKPQEQVKLGKSRRAKGQPENSEDARPR